MKNKLRNFIWIISGIVLMGILVMATTIIKDTGISTINVSTTGNITSDWFLGKLNWSNVQNAPTTNWLLTYNSTYHIWAYNQSDGSYNLTYNIWAYNQSDGSYNLTYNIWAYNQTNPAMTYEYNQTTPAIIYSNTNFYNKSANINTGTYNTTTYQLSTTSYIINEINGACSLIKLHSICANATGTYMIG